MWVLNKLTTPEEVEAAVAVAARRYQAVDPASTLVHKQLEQAYEHTLRQREQLRGCSIRQLWLSLDLLPFRNTLLNCVYFLS